MEKRIDSSEIPFRVDIKEESYVFVSYSHSDKDIVYPEMLWIHKKGIPIWYDEGIPPASDWPDEIAKALLNCKLFLVFLTPNANKSTFVKKEINFALKKNKKILPIFLKHAKLESGLDLLITNLQYIEKYEWKENDYKKKVLDVLIKEISIKEKTEIKEKVKEEDENVLTQSYNSWKKEFIGRHKKSISCLKLSKDDKFLISASFWDKNIMVWNIQTKTPVQIFEEHKEGIQDFDLSSDDKFLISASYDKTIRIWDFNTTNCLNTIRLKRLKPHSVCFSQDCSHFAIGQRWLSIWAFAKDKAKVNFLNKTPKYKGRIFSIQFTSNDKEIIANVGTHKVIKWNWENNAISENKTDQTLKETLMRGSPSGTLSKDGKLYSICAEKKLELWNAHDLTNKIEYFDDYGNYFYTSAFSPNNRYIAYGTSGKKIFISDLENRNNKSELSGVTFSPSALIFSNDGKALFVGSYDGNIYKWSLYPQDDSEDLKLQRSKIVTEFFSEFTGFEAEISKLFSQIDDPNYSDNFEGILFYLIDLGGITQKDFQTFLEIKKRQQDIFLKGLIPSIEQLDKDSLFLKDLKKSIINFYKEKQDELDAQMSYYGL